MSIPAVSLYIATLEESHEPSQLVGVFSTQDLARSELDRIYLVREKTTNVVNQDQDPTRYAWRTSSDGSSYRRGKTTNASYEIRPIGLNQSLSCD